MLSKGKPTVVSLCMLTYLIQCSEMAKRTVLTLWKYSHYLDFLGKKYKNNIMVKCKLRLEARVLLYYFHVNSCA